MRHNISSATTQCSSRQAGLAPKISPFWISLVCSEDRRVVSQSIVPIVHILEDLCNFLIKGDRQCAGLCQSPFQAVLMAKHREETILCCGPPHIIHVLMLQSSLWPLRQKPYRKWCTKNGWTWSPLGITAHAHSVHGAFLIRACRRRGPRSSPAVGSSSWHGVTFVHHGAEESCAASSESGWFLHGQMSARSCCWRHCWFQWLHIHGLYLERRHQCSCCRWVSRLQI